MKEALGAFRNLAAAQPDKALPLTHLAQALVAVGLGEAAREKARLAVVLEPAVAASYDTLGWVLQFDLLGRRFHEGWDPKGAESAYRKAEELDPKDWGFRGDFAYMLTHGPDGERFGPGARLDEAVKEYQYIRDELKIDKKDEQLLIALGFSSRFKETLALAKLLPATALRNAWLAAALTLEEGPAKALLELARILPSASDRREALGVAAEILVNFRKYPEAIALLQAKAQGVEGAAEASARAESLAKAVLFETLKVEPGNPRSALLHLFACVEGEGQGPQAIAKLLTAAMRKAVAKPEEWSGLKDFISAGSQHFRASGTRRKAALDIALSQCQLQVEEAEGKLFRVRAKFVSGAGVYQQDWVFALEDGRCLVAANGNDLGTFGREAMARLERGDAAGARSLLDWAKDLTPRGGGEDPLQGRAFSYLWTRGREATAEDLRLACAALLIWEKDDPRAVLMLQQALASLKDASKRRYGRQALSWALVNQARWDDLEAASQPLREEFPESKAAIWFHLRVLQGRKRWDELLATCEQLIKQFPDEDSYRSLKSAALGHLGRHAEGVRYLESLVQRGEAIAGDFNNLAWTLLVGGAAPERTLELARKAVQLAEESPYAAQHTLASVLAELGRTTEAMDMLKQCMGGRTASQPTGNDWYVAGRIAEQLGEGGMAELCYRKVTPPEGGLDEDTSTHFLAARRLAVLGAGRQQ